MFLLSVSLKLCTVKFYKTSPKPSHDYRHSAYAEIKVRWLSTVLPPFCTLNRARHTHVLS